MRCPCCNRNRVGPIRTWRRNTMYIEQSLNYLTVCIHCIREDDINYAYMWAEYYSGQGYYYPVDYRKRSAKEYVR